MSINKDSKKAPNLRFKGFTDDWEERKLGKIVEFYSGLTYSPDNIIPKGGTFVLRSSNVKNGELINADNVYVDSSFVNSSNVQIGDIVVVVRNGSRNLIGKHAQVKNYMENTVIGAFMTGIRAKEPNYINALLNTQQFKIEINKNLGATINQITTGAFKKMQFSITPNIEEQHEIGSFFDKLDNCITLHQRKLDQLNQLKEALLQQMFPGKCETVPKLRFAGFEGDWDLEPFSELWKQTNEKNKNFEFLPTEVISVSRMKLNPSNRNPKDEYMTTYNIFRKGDIAFEGNKSKKHDFGRFVLNDIQDGIVSHVFVVYRPQANFNSDFMKAYINSEQVMREHLKHSTTKTLMMTTLNNHEIKKRKLKMPTLSEQIKIGDMLKHLDDIITLQQRKLDQLKNTKQVLLQNMFI